MVNKDQKYKTLLINVSLKNTNKNRDEKITLNHPLCIIYELFTTTLSEFKSQINKTLSKIVMTGLLRNYDYKLW